VLYSSLIFGLLFGTNDLSKSYTHGRTVETRDTHLIRSAKQAIGYVLCFEHLGHDLKTF